MINQAAFDEIIRQGIVDSGHEGDLGYEIAGGKTYDCYYSNKAFKAFMLLMKKTQSVFDSYNTGKGGELEEKNDSYGTKPPKMASVASSSRFCYLALSELAVRNEAEFEYECRISGISGTAPQLDAYIKSKKIYVEAKCHEIFTPHKITMSSAYYNLICGDNSDFGIASVSMPTGKTFDISVSEFGLSGSSMFDIKQLLCHLLGIASGKDKAAPATLLYLFFKPKSADMKTQKQVDEVFDRLTLEIAKIFNSNPIQSFSSANNIMLCAAAEYSELMKPINRDNLIVLGMSGVALKAEEVIGMITGL